MAIPSKYIGPEGGKRVLMLHGMTSSQVELTPLANHLAEKGFRCCIPMLAGHGSSVRDFKLTRARAWVLDAYRAIEEASDHGSDKCSIVGHSFGATLGLFLALGRPSIVNKLVLLSPTLVIKPLWGNFILNLASRFPEALLDFLPVIPKRQTNSYCLVVPRTAYPVYSLGATARMFRIIRHIKPRIKSLSLKTLVLHDPDDHLSHKESLEILKNACPKHLLQVIELEDAHHELLAGKHRLHAFNLIQSFLDDSL